jgi:hypothetical protein
MQIRYRNGNIEFLRSTYSAELGRSKAKLISLEDFTEAEKEQHAKHVAEREKEHEKLHAEYAAKSPERNLKLIARGFEAGYKPDNELTFWLAYDELKKSIRKSKMKRPKIDKEEKS